MNRKAKDIQLKILNLLEAEDLGLSISQIADKISLNRNSTAKYLEIMAEKELIYKRVQGPTQKLFYPIRKSKSFEARADYMVRFYQTLHSSLFVDMLGDPKKAREVGYRMAGRGITQLYTKQFENVELTFENIIQFIGIAVEVTYPTPRVKTSVQRNPKNPNNFTLEIKNCICDADPDYRSICEIQTGLIQGVIEDLIKDKIFVEEIECRCDGFDSCKYLVSKLEDIDENGAPEQKEEK
ncbi:MAG: V4R domain-containing protein [Candidatus Helarchaeota archaeon]